MSELSNTHTGPSAPYHASNMVESPNHRPQFHSLSISPTEPLVPPERQNRKVSFSDIIVTSSRVDKRAKLCSDSEELDDASDVRFVEQVSVEEQIVDPTSANEDAGHAIEVLLAENPMEDENIRQTPLINAKAPVYEVRLGMLKQKTVYKVEFVIPDQLGAGECELLRYSATEPTTASLPPPNAGAKLELLECLSNAPNPGHRLVLEMSTTEMHRVSECFTMRLISDPEKMIHFHLHGLSLGRGQGTPFIRAGIHRLGDNPDYDDSDEFTEWPGFVPPPEDDEETEEAANAPGATSTSTAPSGSTNPCQGDSSCN